MSSQRDPLPPAWVDRLFERFTAIFGAQRVGAMWTGSDIAIVKATWGAALGRYQPATIAAAMQRLVDAGNGWPATLPEFVEVCRLAALGRSSSTPALAGPAPDRAAAVEQFRLIADQAAAVRAVRPGREWAHRILRRVASGESVSPTVLAMATKAANLSPDREPGSDDE